MSDLSHTHGGHRQVHAHQQAFVQPATETTNKAAPKVAKQKGPAPVKDTIGTSGTSTSDITMQTHQALYYSGAPILASPHLHGMSSADLMEVVGKALNKHRQRQIQDSVKLDPSNVPDLEQHTDTYTKEVTTTDDKGKTKTDTVTTTVTTTTVQNNVLGRIADTLTDDIFDVIKKHSRNKGQSLSMNQIQAFVQQALTSGALLSIMPALDLLQINGNQPSFLTDTSAAGAATAVSFANLISRSGAAFETFANKILPNNSELAAELASAAKEAFTGLALQQLGTALNLPGLGKQVVAQAAVVRKENSLLQTASFTRTLVPKLSATIVQTTSLSNPQAQKLINKVLDQVASEGDFNTRQEILTALQNAFKKAFPDQPQLAEQLAAQVEADTLQVALSTSGGVYSLQFNPLKLDVATLSDNIKNSILKEFADSERELHAQEVADDIATQIKKAAVDGQLKSAQAVRDAIQSQLITAGYTAGEASQIASQVDLGLPPPEPLVDPNSRGVLSPSDFSASVNNALLANNISPDSSLGQSIISSLGVSDHPASTDMIGMINADHRTDQTRTPNYLLLEPSQQGILQELNFLDPSKQIVLAWSSVMNGTPDRENYKRTSNNTV
ncbi:MAG: hypothetical protein LLG04_09475 [Parachlamydia sp.]|nr:hypothetical protein [Parachlamydia sp.]